MDAHQNKSAVLMRCYGMLHAALGSSHWWPAQTRLEIVVGAVLTQNTAWHNVEKALHNLREQGLLEDGLALLAIPDAALEPLVRPAGFYRLKTQRLKAVLRFFDEASALQQSLCAEVFANTPLETLRRQLLTVKGVGAETADSIMLYALERPSFVVDAYTRRIGVRHGLFAATDGYEQIRQAFMAALPSSVPLYNELHALIVRACQRWCFGKAPRCQECPLQTLTDCLPVVS